MNAAARPLLALMVCALAMVSAGCSAHNAAADILVVDGCIVEIKGLSATQALGIAKTWTFGDDCSIISTLDVGPG